MSRAIICNTHALLLPRGAAALASPGDECCEIVSSSSQGPCIYCTDLDPVPGTWTLDFGANTLANIAACLPSATDCDCEAPTGEIDVEWFETSRCYWKFEEYCPIPGLSDLGYFGILMYEVDTPARWFMTASVTRLVDSGPGARCGTYANYYADCDLLLGKLWFSKDFQGGIGADACTGNFPTTVPATPVY